MKLAPDLQEKTEKVKILEIHMYKYLYGSLSNFLLNHKRSNSRYTHIIISQYFYNNEPSGTQLEITSYDVASTSI